MRPPKNWEDKLALEHRRGVHGVIWMVWDDLDGEEIEGATVGESRPDLRDSDPEYAAVHNAVEDFWKTHASRADWIPDGFWFENITAARKALAIANKALAVCRNLRHGKEG